MPRLYIDIPLRSNATITLTEKQSHYISRVMRLHEGDTLQLFNGYDGEWDGVISRTHKKSVDVTLATCTHKQHNAPDITLLFAPIKAGRIDYLVEKATEMGVRHIQPVKTQRTIVSRVNEERLRANAIEAAEQTERLDVPIIGHYNSLHDVIATWQNATPLVYCDETGGGALPTQVLSQLTPPLAVLIGPEGGFSPQEIAMLKSLPYTIPLSLGPRILRADTAALASLVCVQLYCGDWV